MTERRLHRHLRSLVAALAGVVALCLAGPAATEPAPSTSAPPSTRAAGTPTTPQPRLQFAQLNWLGEAAHPDFQCSRVGTATFVVPPAHSPTAGPNLGGYIQLVTQVPSRPPAWSVRNLYVSYVQPVTPTVQFQLDLPTQSGTCIGNILYSLAITPSPVGTMNTLPTHTAQVAHTSYLVGGRTEGTSGLSSIPLTIGPWVGAPAQPVHTAHTSVPAANIAAIDEAVNGCAPASAARSIKYLMGNAVGTAQGIYDGLAGAMGTGLGEGGGGTSDANMLAGKNAYTSANGLPISSELVYGGANFGAVMNALEGGADVEVLISWEGGGGHAAMVTSITQLANGQYQITYVDDPVQGDGVAANQEHTITVNADGTFPGGTVDGFMVERRTAFGISRRFVSTVPSSIGSPSWLLPSLVART